MLSGYLDRREQRKDAERRRAEAENLAEQRRVERERIEGQRWAERERLEEQRRQDAERRHQEIMALLTASLTALTARNGGQGDAETLRRMQQQLDVLQAEIAQLRAERDNGTADSE